MYEYLDDRIDELKRYKADVVKRLSKLNYKGTPEYHLQIDSKKNQFYVIKSKGKTNGSYIRIDKHSQAAQIATYEYLNRTVRLIDKELFSLEKLRKTNGGLSPEDYYETLCKGRQRLITPIRLTDEQYKDAWLAEPYEPKAFNEDDDSEFYTDKNERVRSKSEIIIANTLSKFNVPYKYECPLYLEGRGVIHPDFTALNVKRRKVRYWEHLGRMDDAGYANKNVKRINSYQRNGIMLGDSLIISMETSNTPLDVKLLEMLIKRFLLE